VVAVKTGDPALIAAAVAADPDLAERAAIREFDGNMSRLDAEIATLFDAIEEAGVVI
jgi:arylsulfatase A-like enzyme